MTEGALSHRNYSTPPTAGPAPNHTPVPTTKTHDRFTLYVINTAKNISEGMDGWSEAMGGDVSLLTKMLIRCVLKTPNGRLVYKVWQKP